MKMCVFLIGQSQSENSCKFLKITFSSATLCCIVEVNQQTWVSRCCLFYWKDNGRYEEAEALLERAVEIRYVVQTFKMFCERLHNCWCSPLVVCSCFRLSISEWWFQQDESESTQVFFLLLKTSFGSLRLMYRWCFNWWYFVTRNDFAAGWMNLGTVKAALHKRDVSRKTNDCSDVIMHDVF